MIIAKIPKPPRNVKNKELIMVKGSKNENYCYKIRKFRFILRSNVINCKK